MQITCEERPNSEDVARIRDGLAAFNRAHTGQQGGFTPLTLCVRDETGAVQGGLLGGTYWGWLAIDFVWLDESLRGQGIGRQLVTMAEQIAIERGCIGAHLDTMSFQAPEFYHKLGYREYGRIDDLPAGHSRIFLKKVLRPEG